MILYHWTSHKSIEAITECGYIATSPSLLRGGDVAGDIGCVFLTDMAENVGFGVGADDSRIASPAARAIFDYLNRGRFRITVDIPDALAWSVWAKRRRMSPQMWKRHTTTKRTPNIPILREFVVERRIYADEWVEIRDMTGALPVVEFSPTTSRIAFRAALANKPPAGSPPDLALAAAR